jgi:hypothetical protein
LLCALPYKARRVIIFFTTCIDHLECKKRLHIIPRFLVQKVPYHFYFIFKVPYHFYIYINVYCIKHFLTFYYTYFFVIFCVGVPFNIALIFYQNVLHYIVVDFCFFHLYILILSTGVIVIMFGYKPFIIINTRPRKYTSHRLIIFDRVAQVQTQAIVW